LYHNRRLFILLTLTVIMNLLRASLGLADPLSIIMSGSLDDDFWLVRHYNTIAQERGVSFAIVATAAPTAAGGIRISPDHQQIINRWPGLAWNGFLFMQTPSEVLTKFTSLSKEAMSELAVGLDQEIKTAKAMSVPSQDGVALNNPTKVSFVTSLLASACATLF
jgi:hypothetical protein